MLVTSLDVIKAFVGGTNLAADQSLLECWSDRLYYRDEPVAWRDGSDLKFIVAKGYEKTDIHVLHMLFGLLNYNGRLVADDTGLAMRWARTDGCIGYDIGEVVTLPEIFLPTIAYWVESSGNEIDFFIGDTLIAVAQSIPLTDDYNLDYSDNDTIRSMKDIRDAVELVWREAVNEALQLAYESFNEPAF